MLIINEIDKIIFLIFKWSFYYCDFRERRIFWFIMYVKLFYEVVLFKIDIFIYIMGGRGGFIFDYIWMFWRGGRGGEIYWEIKVFCVIKVFIF